MYIFLTCYSCLLSSLFAGVAAVCGIRSDLFLSYWLFGIDCSADHYTRLVVYDDSSHLLFLRVCCTVRVIFFSLLNQLNTEDCFL
jgi:hypothetical protein